MDNGVMLTENALREAARSIELFYDNAPNKDWLVSTCRNAAEQFETMRAEVQQLRRAQPSEKPLTLEELRGMDGEPVWVERLWGAKIKKWIIASPNEYGLTQGVHEKSQFMAWKTYGVLWRALRSRPKEEAL